MDEASLILRDLNSEDSEECLDWSDIVADKYKDHIDWYRTYKENKRLNKTVFVLKDGRRILFNRLTDCWTIEENYAKKLANCLNMADDWEDWENDILEREYMIDWPQSWLQYRRNQTPTLVMKDGSILTFDLSKFKPWEAE